MDAGSHKKKPRPLLSVVIPARDEAENLTQLIEEIVAALRPRFRSNGSVGFPYGFEILVVDDGSVDNTREILRELMSDHRELRPMILERNLGQSAALAAGIRASRGKWVATLDADLQNDPSDLLLLWDALPGHDAALGWRTQRRDPWSKRVISRIANKVRNAALGENILDTGCSTRILRRDLARGLPRFQGMHRFLGTLLLREGARIVQVPVSHRPRIHGNSHYNLWNRSWRVLIDLLGVCWLSRRGLGFRVTSVEALLTGVAEGSRTSVSVSPRRLERWGA